MNIKFHPHAEERLLERGATKEEVIITIESGERFSAKYGRIGFRRNILFQNNWRNKFYNTKQLEVYAVQENNTWVVISIITKYF